MRKTIIIMALALGSSAIAQGRFFTRPEVETFEVSTFGDVGASFKERGLDIGIEAGYNGVIYAKVQLESFAALEGGYLSIGGAVGKVFQQWEWQEYIGVRLIPAVFRAGTSVPIIGFESGLNWDFMPNAFVGLRTTADYRYDSEILDSGTAKWRVSGFIKIGFRLPI